MRPHSVDRVSLRGGFVGTMAFHAREAQGHATGIVRAGLDVVEGDLDDQFRSHVHDIVVAGDFQGEQRLRLPRQHRVGEPLEGLAQHHETTAHRIAGAKVQVAQPTLASARAPLDSEHHEIERARGLHLEPRRPAASRGVHRIARLGHHAFVPLRKGLLEKPRGLFGTRRKTMRDHQGWRDQRGQRVKALVLRPVEQVVALGVQHVEEDRCQRQLRAQRLHVESPPEAPHRVLERARRAIGLERQNLAVEDQRTGWHRPHGFDDFGDGRCHGTQRAREHQHLVAGLVDLNAGAVEFVLERRFAQRRQRLADIVGGVSQHRLHGLQNAEAEGVECRGAASHAAPSPLATGRPPASRRAARVRPARLTRARRRRRARLRAPPGAARRRAAARESPARDPWRGSTAV